MHQVYVIENASGQRYVGLSDDPARRLRQHNAGQSRWTKRGAGTWRIIWSSEMLTLSNARKLENRLKCQGRGSGFYSITGIPRPGGS